MQRKIMKIAPVAIQQAPQLLRVAAYARVSSGKEAMLHSLSAQVSHYSEKIQNTPGWKYAGVYADEATTGTKDSREEFQKLLAACRAGQIDLIITKSISRFARNTVTTLKTVRELRRIGVDVYFEEQHIHTLGEEGELLLTLLAAYAEEEARSVSQNQKWRIQANFEQGLPWSVTMYGYRLVDGRLVKEPLEAEFLKLAADLYLEGCGQLSLERALRRVGAVSRQGKPIRGNAVVKLICNEKVAGDMLLQKTFVSDPITKVGRINKGELPQYFVEGSHEPILDRDTYEKVLAERARRAALYQPNPQTPPVYPFTGLMTCGKCGAHFRRKIAGAPGYKKPVWICATFNSKGKALCASKQIPEDILKNAAAQAMGLPVFDEAAFTARIKEIRVPENGVLVFVFDDGRTITETWENPSRRYSWNDEKREKARALSLQKAAERRAALCKQQQKLR